MRLIDADALLEKAWDADTRCGYVQVVDVGDIEEAPTVDATKAAKEAIYDIETWKTPDPIAGSERWIGYHEGWNAALELAIECVKQRFGIKESEKK